MKTVIALFLRWPEPGKVKTRLIPTLGAEGAAQLYERMALRTAAQIPLSAEIERWAYVTPPEQSHNWAARLGPDWIPIAQPEADLGARLLSVLDEAFRRGAHRTFVAGSDCPSLTSSIWSGALRALGDHDAVLGPAHDGGYYVLGVKRAEPSLFRGIEWSTARVADQTRAAMRALGWNWFELPQLRDVDTSDDLDPPDGASRE
jgi:rSAM/selenodomain-associated transferase 1